MSSPRRGVARRPSRGVALLAAAVIVAAPAPGLRSDSPQEARIKLDVALVLVEATVKNRAGRVLGDLKQEDFRVSEDGTEQQIAHFSRDQLPLAVALVVDLSSSIEPFLRPLRYATLTTLKTLKEEDEVALFTFSTGVERRVALTRDKREVADEIEFFATSGSTNINDGVYHAARYLHEERPAARRVIILVSDNVPTERGRADHRRVVEAALEADTAVYSIRVPGRNPHLARLHARAAGMGFVNVSKLCEETGGEMFDIEKEGTLTQAFQTLIERLKTRYTLGYYPANHARDGRFRALEVRLGAPFGAKGKDYSIVSKRGYYSSRG